MYLLHARHNFSFVVYIWVQVINFSTDEIPSRFNNPIKLLFTCYCWVSLHDENVCVTNFLYIPYNGDNVIKLHFKKIQVQKQGNKESNISVYIINILFVYFSLKSFNLWNKMKYILLRQCAHVFNRYSINKNRKKKK